MECEDEGLKSPSSTLSLGSRIPAHVYSIELVGEGAEGSKAMHLKTYDHGRMCVSCLIEAWSEMVFLVLR